MFHESVVVIEEEWFSGMNLTDGAKILTVLIKPAKTRVNQKVTFPRDTKRRTWEISIKWLEHTYYLDIV